jgi:TonB family protein
MKVLLIVIIILCSFQVFPQKKPKKITAKIENTEKHETFYLQDGLREGKYALFYKTNKMVEGNFTRGAKNGLWIYYAFDGKCICKCFYGMGKRVGKWQYFKNDTLISILAYDSITGIDTLKGFFPNGQIAQLKINDNHTERSWFIKFHPNGNKFEEEYYLKNKLSGLLRRFNKKGEYMTGLFYKDDNPFTLSYSNDSLAKDFSLYAGSLKSGNGSLMIFSPDSIRILRVESNFKNGLLDGIYKQFYSNGSIKIEGQFMNGFMVNQWKAYNEDGKCVKDIYYSLAYQLQDDPKNGFSNFQLTDTVRVMPVFHNKSSDYFREYIALTMKYPELAAEKGIQGRVYVQFCINSLGEVVDAIVLDGPDELLDKEALRVVNASPNWEPGYMYYLPVKVQFSFPMNFLLQ